MDHITYLTSVYDLQDCFAVDVGAGDGSFAREMTAYGARVTGIEVEQDKVEVARKTCGTDVEMRQGRGEELPVDDNTQDLVCFIFSFHHVPLNVQPDALRETARVLKPNGCLHVVDPKAYGPMTDVLKFVEDEIEVRTASQARLDGLGEKDGFHLLSKSEYVITRGFADFEALAKFCVFVDPGRAALLPSVREDMEEMFHDRSQRTQEGYVLEQPCVAYHYRKTA